MKTQYGLLAGILLLSCSSLDNSMRNSYSIVEDTFDKKYIISGVERQDKFPARKSVSNDRMRYSLRTDAVEIMDTLIWVNSIEIEHLYNYYRFGDDTTAITLDKIELEKGGEALLEYVDAYSVPALPGECCKVWEKIDIILPEGYLEEVDIGKDMLVRLNDTQKRYDYILTFTPEMIAMQEEGLKALIKQLGLEKNDGVVNIIQQTDF